MNKIPLSVFSVNSQEGFLIDSTNQPVACYTHHKKYLVWREGLTRNQFDLPKNYEDYEDVAVAGHFNVGFYDMASGYNLDEYIVSQMWAARDEKTNMRHIRLAIRQARQELKTPVEA